MKRILFTLLLIGWVSLFGQKQTVTLSNENTLPSIEWADKKHVMITPIPVTLESKSIVEQEAWTSELLSLLRDELINTGLEKIISEITNALTGSIFGVVKAIIDEIPTVGGYATSSVNFLLDGNSSNCELIANSNYVLLYTYDNQGSMYHIPSEIILEKAKISVLGVILSWEEIKTIKLLDENENSDLLESGHMSFIYALKNSFTISSPGIYKLDGKKFEVLVDTKSPKIIGEEIDFNIDGKIKLLVSENLNLTSVNSKNISVTGTVSGKKELILSTNENYINITPKTNFHPDEEVVILLSSGIKDLANNSLTTYQTKYSINNSIPQLSNNNLTPSIGNEKTNYKFSIKYYDADGDFPIVNGAKLYLYGNQDKIIQMQLESGSESNGIYTCATTLPVGNYSYRISFQNSSNQNIITDLLDGPKVLNSSNMTIIPYLICGVDETAEIEFNYDINDDGYKKIQLEIGKNKKVELSPNSKIDISLSTKGNYTFDKYKLKQNNETVWEHNLSSSSTSIQFTEYAAGIFELRIYLDYTPNKYEVSGIIRNEDNSPYVGSINISLNGFEDLATTSSNGEYKFQNVKGGVPIKIKASGVPAGYALNPEEMSISNLKRDETDIDFRVSSNDNKVPEVYLINKPEAESSTNNISFSWLGRDNVSTTENILYQYKLEGYESDWNEWSNSTEANYKLSNGFYKLLLRAKDESGNYSNIIREYEFIVNANPSIEKNEKTTNGVWSTKIKLINRNSENNCVILRREHSLSNDMNIVPVRLYRINEDLPCGAYEDIATRLNLDTVFTKQGDYFILQTPDIFPDSSIHEYIIEWGKEISFGWQSKKEVIQGFSNITDIPPFSSDETEDRYLDKNFDLWRVATSNKRIETDDKYIYDSWTYIDKANEDGIIIDEKIIENLQGSWESGVKYSRPKCYAATIAEIESRLFISIREDLYERTYPSGESTNTNKERYVVNIINKNGTIIKTITGEWGEHYYSLPKNQINNSIWITNEHSNETENGLGFTIINSDGSVIKNNYEYHSTENSHSLDNVGCYSMNLSSVLILFEESWETSERDDRTNICFQIRSNSGELLKSTTVLNPTLSDENIKEQDEYQIDDVISDNNGQVWISYEHDYGSETNQYYVVLGSSGTIIHGPVKIDSDMDFYVCDKDNYIWAERGGFIYLYDTEFNEHKFNAHNFIFPNQNIGDVVARVNYYDYQIFDRWNSIDFNVINELDLKNDEIELFHLPFNNDLLLNDVLVKFNDDEIINISNDFPNLYKTEFSGLNSNSSNMFSLSQNSLLGGSILFTFPLTFNNTGINVISNKDCIVNIYPNPVKNKMIIESLNSLTDNSTASIIDIYGNTINNLNIENPKSTIDCSHLSSGIYFLIIKSKANIKAIKFVKE